jgi:hypothetical protein
LGELSRRGIARGKEALKAQDKDPGTKQKLVPFGIPEVQSGESTIVFGTSRETSDFIVESLELWWQERKASHGHIRQLVINLDNGPLSANCSRFQRYSRLVPESPRRSATELAEWPSSNICTAS